MKTSITSLVPEDPSFPPQLLHVDPKPQRLYQKGTFDQTLTCISIVGSRKHSAYGRMVTKAIVEYLAQFSVCIVSGLALGIDSVAHRAALEYKVPTIAFLPGGIHRIYPANRSWLIRLSLTTGH